MSYSGYKNYETWCISLWIWNDEGLYRYWREQADTCNLADALQEWATELMPELQGFFSDLLTHALGMVYWDEIASELRDATA